MKTQHRLSDSITAEQVRRYVWKLHPTAEQARILHRQRVMMGQLWNALKQRCEDTYRRTREREGRGKMLSYFDLTNEITELRHACPEWAEVPAVTAHRVAKHLVEAYAGFFHRVKQGAGHRAGYPRWVNAARTESIPLGTMETTGWRLEYESGRNWYLYYLSTCTRKDKSTWIHARGRLPGNVASLPRAWRNADIICRDGAWWLSVAVCMSGRRTAGRDVLSIRFGVIGDLAEINGVPYTPIALREVQRIEAHAAELQARCDQRWPRGSKRDDVAQCEWMASRDEIVRLRRNAARRRADALHVWTANIVRQAAKIIIETPRISEMTASPHGDQREWGANVADVSALNRDVLSYAPARAVAMLLYKSAEAGIECEVRVTEDSDIDIGRELVVTGKRVRRAKRLVKQGVEAAA